MGEPSVTVRCLARAAELTARTSQLNATGVAYDDATLRALPADDAHEVLVAGMSDRFGSHGMAGIVLLRRTQRVWHLELLATSCRVVSLGAGWVVGRAEGAGVRLAADFRPTGRNRIMDVAYRFAGFGDEDRARLSTLDDRVVGGVQRPHLLPGSRPVSPYVIVDAVDLTNTVVRDG